MRRLAFVLLATSSIASVSAQAPGARDVRAWMARVGERVQIFYARAQSLICEEIVRIEPLGIDLLPSGDHVRELVYELRVDWDGAPPGPDGKLPEATVLRQLVTVNGRPPKPGDEPGCFDSKPVTPEPLSMLLPTRQDEYVFTLKGPGRESGRASVAIDYKSVPTQDPIEVHEKADFPEKGECWDVKLPGRRRGRLWIDPSTADVLRLDESLAGQYDVRLPDRARRRGGVPLIVTFERLDSSISYRAVTFHDPDETLILPASIVSLQVARESGQPRLRTYQKFSKYRRFITDARIVQ